MSTIGKIFLLIIFLSVTAAVSAEEQRRYYITAAGTGSLYFGSALADDGFDGVSYYFPEDGTVLLPVYDLLPGGGWFLSAGISFDAIPLAIEIGGGQTYHSGTWTLTSGTWGGIDYGDLSSLAVISQLELIAVYTMPFELPVTPQLSAGTGVTGVHFSKGSLTEDNAETGGYGGFYLRAGGGCTYSFTERFELLGRIGYTFSILTAGIWDSTVAELDTGIREHSVQIMLGGRYWLPF